MAPVRRGIFVTFEGPDGGGKTTQLRRLADRLERAAGPGATEVLVTREPGGTAAGERIRQVLLDPAGGALEPATEALLFCAARAELVAQVIRPALAAGGLVLSDRFADSTLAYQGYGRGLDLGHLAALNALATGGLTPDRTLLLDLPAGLGLSRRRREGGWNRLDDAGTAFHERVRDGFLALAAAEPERWTVVDAAGDADAVAEAIWRIVAPLVVPAGQAVPELDGGG
jgi:dTMP kinase